MAGKDVSKNFDPLAIVQSWAERPGTVSHQAATSPARPSPSENFERYLSKLPTADQQALIMQAETRRADKIGVKQGLMGSFMAK